MKIAFEASSISSYRPTGIANYGHSLVSELVNLCGDRDKFTFLYKISRYQKRYSLYKPDNVNSQFYVPQLPYLIPKYDIIHSLDTYLSKWRHAKKLVTIHDLFVLVNGQEDYFSKKFVQRKRNHYQAIRKYADSIITVSNTTKTDVVERMGVPSDRVYVAHLGITENYKRQSPAAIQSVKDKYRIDDNYLFFVGNVCSRKNVQRLIRAFYIGKFYENFKLVLCGSNSYRSDIALREIDRLKIRSNVLTLNYVDDMDLPALYSGATGFVFPTLYEGFGLPPLEAMACETPVLTSTTGAAPEVCGEHAVLVDPYSVDDIAAGIEKLLRVTPDKIAAARSHANQYTWRRCAEKTLSVYQEIL